MRETPITITEGSHPHQALQYYYIDDTRGIAILGVIAVPSYQGIKDLSQPVSWIYNWGHPGSTAKYPLSPKSPMK